MVEIGMTANYNKATEFIKIMLVTILHLFIQTIIFIYQKVQEREIGKMKQ